MDDVEDDSQLRRGVPGASPARNAAVVVEHTAVAHKIYGVPQAINSANYVYFLAYQEIFKLRDRLKAEHGDNVPDLDTLINGSVQHAFARRMC